MVLISGTSPDCTFRTGPDHICKENWLLCVCVCARACMSWKVRAELSWGISLSHSLYLSSWCHLLLAISTTTSLTRNTGVLTLLATHSLHITPCSCVICITNADSDRGVSWTCLGAFLCEYCGVVCVYLCVGDSGPLLVTRVILSALVGPTLCPTLRTKHPLAGKELTPPSVH